MTTHPPDPRRLAPPDPRRAHGRRPATDLAPRSRRPARFAALRAVVGDLGPTGTVATIAASGLRGPRRRGLPRRRASGARWPSADDPVRYVVANGYEADPAPGHEPPAHGDAARSRSSRASRSRPSPSAPARRSSPCGPSTPTRSRALESAVFAAEEAGFLGTDVLGSGRDVAVDRPHRAGRLHAGRGDGPAQGPRGEARPARAAPAVPVRARASSATRRSSTTW